MAIAGKVAITLSTENGGAWSADVTYDRLVAVKHNNNLYISRKTVVNLEPPNDEFWFLALEGFGGEDVEVLIDRMNELSDLIQAIIDGTTQVGNAKTVNGFAVYTDVSQLGISSYHIPDIVRAMPTMSMFISSNDSRFNSAEANNSLPAGSGTIEIIRPRTDAGRTRVTYLGCVNAQKYGVYLCDLDENNWVIKSWKHVGDGGNAKTLDGHGAEYFAKAADLANYLPLYGGGTLNAPLDVILSLMATESTNSYLQFKGKNGIIGHFGFVGVDNPVFLNASNTAMYNLLHTGNKPTGTYTGNGSATQRTVNIGGVGNVCYINGGGNTIVAHRSGAFSMGYNGTITGIAQAQCNFYNGVLTIATDSVVNNNGTTYTYQVL